VKRVVLDTSVLVGGSFDLDGECELAVPCLAFAELSYGIGRAGITPRQKAERSKRLSELRRRFPVGLPFDDDAAASYGIITELVEHSGRQARGRAIDLMIAAVAHANNAALATLNPKDVAPLETIIEIIVPEVSP
jgi:predicted nucleic acid-binding protein